MYDGLNDRKTLETFGKWYLKGKQTPSEPNGVGLQGKQHDFWNLYDYGGELKLVYVKCGFISKPEKKPSEDSRSDGGVTPSQREDSERLRQSISRAKSRIFELAICNEFTHFCTFTLDKEKRDRGDLAAFRKAFAQMVRNINRGREDAHKIKYLLIPEPHKNGAWHMHGLLKGFAPNDLTAFKLSDKIPERLRRQIRTGEKVYNWTRYAENFGFFTATEIQSRAACSRYVTKYVTKELGAAAHAAGAHLYYASQGLEGRQCLYKNSFEAPPDFGGWDFENEYVKVRTLTADEVQKLFDA